MLLSRLSWTGLLLALPARAFYLPGASPHSYRDGEQVALLVNAVGPRYGEGETAIVPYDAYDERIGFCRPASPHSVPLSLGSALFGERLWNSDFDLRVRQNTTCQTLCTTTLTDRQLHFLPTLIGSHSHHWLVDGLPAAEMRRTADGELFYSPGFPVGRAVRDRSTKTGPRSELNNHWNIILEYHPRPKEGNNRIVGVVVWPQSIDSLRGRGSEPDCSVEAPLVLATGGEQRVAYTYSVTWRESATPWATRWDTYLRILTPRIHVLALFNSFVICGFLCLLVGIVLLRVLSRDIKRYNALASYDLDLDHGAGDSAVDDDSGWKVLHGEVFRAPKYRMWLCITVGTGAQMAAMCGVTLFFATLGFLNPSNRGALSTTMVVCWTLFGSIAGYTSSRLYLSMNGDAIRKNIIYTALVFPAALYAFLLFLDAFLIGLGSAGAVPVGTFLAIGALWSGINVPLTIVGGWMGVKKGPLNVPVRVNQIPRQVPPLPWWLKPVPSALLAGVLPFGAGFIEISQIARAIFGSKLYYAFGFLCLASAIVGVTAALTTVLFAYFHLCAEDYRWHWRSFLAGAGSSFYIFAYGLLYWASKLHLPGFANKVLYLGYLALVSGLSGIVTGTIGFAATWGFLRVIYSRIRVD
ncbi:endosomal P24A protein [Rhodotorula diobovata]|uniref:Transmembrane 9 superfamily member n=1 Tax=Rhodotorula diobovata TaxID=5288 RepID=A0A5C5FTW1_9BASI|nr:endosomal P24A protein [Rhodotorula diobovata]